jgi:uncharacterized protein YndB with AHSA1/START domain
VTVVTAEVDIAASPEEVWRVVSDPRNLPIWDRHVVAVTGVPETGIRKGTEYTTEVRFVGVGASVSARVEDLQRPHYARLRLNGILEGTVETWLEPQNEGATRLRHRVDYRFKGGPLGSLAAQTIRVLGASAMLRRGTQAQKRQIERG